MISEEEIKKTFQEAEDEGASYVEVKMKRMKGTLYSAWNSTLMMSDINLDCTADRKKNLKSGEKRLQVNYATNKLGPIDECKEAISAKCEEEDEYVLGIPMSIPVCQASALFTIVSAWTSVAAKTLSNLQGLDLVDIMKLPLKGSSIVPFTSFAEASSEGFIQTELKTHIELLSLTSAVMFIGSLRGLNSLKTAHQGNYLGMAASALGIVSVLASPGFGNNYARFFGTFAAGSLIGAGVAWKVQMEDMPQLVAGFHSFVAVASVLVGFANLFGITATGGTLVGLKALETFLGVAIGSLTVTGSICAAGKLHGVIPGQPIVPPYRWGINGIGLLASTVMGIFFCHPHLMSNPALQPWVLFMNAVVWSGLGVNMIMPIGGADMPVIVSLLNSFSGLATAAAGFMLGNDLLTITGALIASSGALLSDIMCRGINRSLTSVLLGGFGTADGTLLDSDQTPIGVVQEMNADSFTDKLLRAKRIVVIPGFGMSVARCQQKLKEVTNQLEKRGIVVHFAIHPVAGRMPGHMNVLLAEAKVTYDSVKEMDEVNDDIKAKKYDIAIVLGANDIVNPDALTNEKSPIYGMPTIEVWECKLCVVLKRSMATGYSGINNPLFYRDNVRMLFGDAKKSLEKINQLLEERPISSEKLESFSTLGNDVEEQEQEIEYPEAIKILGCVKESEDGETRVAIAPCVISKLRLMGYSIIMEVGAGEEAGFSNMDYINAGAEVQTRDDVFKVADIVLKVNGPTMKDIKDLQPKTLFIGAWSMMEGEKITNSLIEQKKTAFNMELIPRISRAQKLDMITSMANIAGYRAVLDAFNRLPKFSRTGVTACGNIPPAKVFIIGTGVAGLSAIATAVGLGAKVYASDVRLAAKEQVESLGAEFLIVPSGAIEGEGAGGYAEEQTERVLQEQRNFYLRHCVTADVVISTAMIPNKPAPLIITKEMVDQMKPMSVIIDLAAKRGGNCSLTQANKVIVHYGQGNSQASSSKKASGGTGSPAEGAPPTGGVIIVGTTNYPAVMAQTASELLSRNFQSMLEVLGMNEPDMEDVIIRQTCIVLNGQLKYPPPKPRISKVDTAERSSLARSIEPIESAATPELVRIIIKWLEAHKEELAMGLGLGVICALGFTTNIPTEEVTHLGYFCLSLLIGHFTVASVTPSLHTPLVSVTNAISGIIVIGGMLQLSGPIGSAKVISALLAVFFSSVNIVGGFAVTHRMLDMFKQPEALEDEKKEKA